jgi:hypothetical protein
MILQPVGIPQLREAVRSCLARPRHGELALVGLYQKTIC